MPFFVIKVSISMTSVSARRRLVYQPLNAKLDLEDAQGSDE